jgi:hypothetical protein
MPDIGLLWTKQDDNPNGEWRIYRSQDGSLGSELTGGLSVGTSSYTDTGLAEGVKYHYTLRRDTGDATADSTQSKLTTTLPVPIDNTVDAERDTEIDQSWTLQSVDEAGVRIYRRQAGGSYSEVADLPAGAESYTHTGLLNGEEYEVYAEAYTDDAASTSRSATGKTTLPDEDQPVLGNGVEDEVAIDRESAATNNGSVRLQIRETGGSTWDTVATGFAEQTVSFDTITTQFTGREDGEEYEVRARTETQHRTGAWTAPVSIIAKFPGATNLIATALSPTEAELTWDDNADNEAGQDIVRERLVDGEWWPERVIDDAGPNTETFVDDTVPPDTTVRYRIRAYTPDASAESNTDTVTTPDIGLSRICVPATGPLVQVDHPDGDTLTPTVVDYDWSPDVNTRPTAEVTVPQSDRWEELTGQPMRIWIDGTQLPIDTLEGVRTVTGDRGSRTVLEAAGGEQLDEYTDDIQFDERENHLAGEDLIAEYTDYESNVDDPVTNVRDGVLQLSRSGESITDVLANAIDPTDPLEVTQLDGVAMLPVGWFREIENGDYTGSNNFAADDEEWSNDETISLQGVGDSYSFDIEVHHKVPAGELVLRQLWAPVGGNPPLNINFDGSTVESIPGDAVVTATDRYDISWILNTVLNPNGAVTPGMYTVSVSVTTGDGSGEIFADAAHVRDDRFSFTFDETPENGVVNGPEEYPAAVDVVLDDIQNVEQVIGGSLDVAMSSTAGNQAVAISNDGGSSWIEASNAESVEGSFANASQQIRARVTLSRYSTDASTSPAQGDAGQSVDDIELRADLEDTPVLLDKQYRDRLDNVLADVAEDGRMVWELRRDPDADPRDPTGMIVEWTQIGQRTRSTSAAATNVEKRTTIESAYERVVVFGRSKRVEENTFSTASQAGQPSSIGNEWVVPDSERIYDPDTGEEFERGVDYRMEWDIGGLVVLNEGSMSLSTTYGADFEYKYRGEATTPSVDASKARTIERQIPGATSDRECEQLALSILKDVQEEQVEATLTLVEPDPDVPLVEAISHPRLPEGAQEIQGVERSSTSERTYRLANRRTAGEIVDDLRDDYESLADVV